MDSGAARPKAALAATYAECCLNLVKALAASGSSNLSACPSAGGSDAVSRAEQAVKLSWKLVAAFSGLVPKDAYVVRTMRLKALGLQLLSVWKGGERAGGGRDHLRDALLSHACSEFLGWMRQVEK
jgi:hypothetical protein